MLMIYNLTKILITVFLDYKFGVPSNLKLYEENSECYQ